MKHTISNNYRHMVYASYLPLVLLPFAWILARELALNIIITSPHTDFSIRLPFNLSHNFYLAAMCLFVGLGASTIKAFLDNSPKVNLLYKSGYGLFALAVFIFNAEFILKSFSLLEMLVYLVLPITITTHLISLRRIEVFDNILTTTDAHTAHEEFADDISLEQHTLMLLKPVVLRKVFFWKKNTISISEYFEMELGESLKLY